MESAATRLLATVASGAIGLLIGSFLNVVVWRLPRHESITHPPSHCPACGTPLRPIDNVPVVSWLALRGRCHHCSAPISARYPLVELATAALFVAIALGSVRVEPIASLDAVVAASLAIVAIDLDGESVPAVLGWVAAASSATLVAVSLSAHDPARLGWAGIGAGAALAAWGLSVLLARSAVQTRFPPAAASAAWGFAAGWAVPRWGPLAVTVILAAAAPVRRRNLPLGALVGTAAIAVIVLGTVTSR
jgi:leader peptidase (prepilin peptidase)/N-methyltransferase